MNTSHKWEPCIGRPNRWYLTPSDKTYCNDYELIALERCGDVFMIDDSFSSGWKWRLLEDVKTFEEAKAVCEIIWRMR